MINTSDKCQLQYHTAESVTQGHPDKICDTIAASILDAAIIASRKCNAQPRVAIEVSVKGDLHTSCGTVMLFGEVTLPHGVTLDYERIARQAIKDIGYDNPKFGFWHKLKNVYTHITHQSSDINRGVSKKQTGAGDQGLMFGGAVAGEGPEFMPLPIMIAHALTQKQTELFKSRKLPYLRPDGKAQVVVLYDNGKPVSLSRITIAAAHDTAVELGHVRKDLTQQLITPILDRFGFAMPARNNILINGAGHWNVFGPLADAGTTNRKIIVDSYGGAFPHGGGGFNGKDWTKVDVIGAIGARFVAKMLVAQQLAQKVQVEIGYSIGHPDPIIVNIDAFGTEKVSLTKLQKHARKVLDLSVDGIINAFKLRKNALYVRAAAGGWFGRSEFPWEHITS